MTLENEELDGGERIDLDGTGRKLRALVEIPIIDEQRMKKVGIGQINEFVNRLSIIIFGEKTYNIEYDNFLSIYPLNKEKDFGTRIRFLPWKTPANYFPAILMSQQILVAKRKGEIDDRSLEEPISLYSVFENGNKKEPLFKVLRIHYEPLLSERRIKESIFKDELNLRSEENISRIQMYKSESLG